MSSLRIEFHMPRSGDSLLTALENNNKKISNKSCMFFKDMSPYTISRPYMNDAYAIPTSHVRAFVVLILLSVRS
jgi:hypothetical protein